MVNAHRRLRFYECEAEIAERSVHSRLKVLRALGTDEQGCSAHGEKKTQASVGNTCRCGVGTVRPQVSWTARLEATKDSSKFCGCKGALFIGSASSRGSLEKRKRRALGELCSGFEYFAMVWSFLL